METDQAVSSSPPSPSRRARVFRLLIENEPEGLAAGEVARRMASPQTHVDHLADPDPRRADTAERQSRSICLIARVSMPVRELCRLSRQDCCGDDGDCAPLLAISRLLPPKTAAKETARG